MTFGESLKELRISRGLSQRELGTRLGVSQQTIAQYERASFIPKAQTMQRLADALEISPDEFWIKTSKYPERDVDATKELNGLSSANYFSLNEAKIIPLIKRLNDKGLLRAHSYLEDLNKIPEYSKHPADSVSTDEILAAHTRTDVEQTPEGLQHDLDIMNDDKNWE